MEMKKRKRPDEWINVCSPDEKAVKDRSWRERTSGVVRLTCAVGQAFQGPDLREE
jgi:hypothetical protein